MKGLIKKDFLLVKSNIKVLMILFIVFGFMTFNGEKYIKKCMDSVINQTIGINNIQIIVIDDVCRVRVS